MSVAGGLATAFDRAVSIGTNTMQIFTKNQNRWAQKPTPPEEIEKWIARRATAGVAPVVSHAAYLINLGTADEEIWSKSTAALIDELERAEQIELLGVVFHPGGHMGAGIEAGLARIIDGLDRVHAATPGYRTLTLLENTAGQGTHLGHTFEQLRVLIEGVRAPERVGVCLDTCHLHASGYELRTAEGYRETMEQFDQTVGLDRVRCFHFNDSKKDFGSRVDRHEQIGRGTLGLEPFRFILNDPRFTQVPMILETDKSEDMHEDVENLRVLRSLINPPQA